MPMQKKNKSKSGSKSNVFRDIIENKRTEVELRKKEMPLEFFVSGLSKSKRNFADAIRRTRNHRHHIIAEIKPASPSGGNIRNIDEAELLRITAIYNKYAHAISVLTDEKYFGGCVNNLKIVSEASKIPVLRKDFIIDAYQIYEARYYGADAVLLIVSVLDIRDIKEYMRIASGLGMGCLVEVHDRKELDIAIKIGSEMIGINNRNLSTMKVNLRTTYRLAQYVPDEAVAVSESGIRTPDDVKYVFKQGSDAVLVGTAIMDGDVERNLKELTGALR